MMFPFFPVNRFPVWISGEHPEIDIPIGNTRVVLALYVPPALKCSTSCTWSMVGLRRMHVPCGARRSAIHAGNAHQDLNASPTWCGVLQSDYRWVRAYHGLFFDSTTVFSTLQAFLENL